MKILKRIAALLLVISMCFSMAGCEDVFQEMAE